MFSIQAAVSEVSKRDTVCDLLFPAPDLPGCDQGEKHRLGK